MNAERLKIFQDITLGYFAKIAPEAKPPVLQEAYLRFDSGVFLDYTSVVTISGAYEGCIYLTAPSRFLEMLLALHHETQVNDQTRFDMCRELANVLAGNASHAFGADWTISVPQSLTAAEAREMALPPSTFVMPFVWREIESILVIGLRDNGKDK